MKKRSLLVTFFLILSFNNVFADVEQRRNELLKVLDEELREVVRLNKQTEGTKPHLMLRMGQILLEKARLIKDQENQKFIEIPQEQRAKVSLEEHFKESRKYFDQAQKTVLVLLKKFPRFEDRGDAYYILAYNAKELKQEDESRKYFQKTIDESRADSVTAEKAKIALAETYFNKGSYDKSLNLYESALKVKRDKWWTKDAFNLAWCYFKVGKIDKAIEVMNESYDLSKNSKFIDMSKSIERDIAFFYTEAGRSNEAVQFYKKNGKNVAEVLLKVGRFLKNQGKFTAAEKTLTDAIALKQSEKEETDITIELLSLFEKFGKYDKHLDSCKFLAVQFDKGSLNNDQIETLKFNVAKVGAILQQQVVDKTFDHQPEVRDRKVSSAVEYFSIEAKVNGKKAQESLFHAGETYFAVGNFDKAVPFYADAMKASEVNSDKKFYDLSSNALMVSLSKGVKKETSDKYLVPAYLAYLNANPKGEKASSIYQRLFSNQMELKDLAAAESTLNKYHQNLPQENETQEKMVSQVMDAYRAKNDRVSILSWSKKIDNGEYKVSPDFSKKVKELGLSMQFEKVEEASNKGDKKSALKGYYQIYKSPDSSLDARKMAAYNIAVLFYEVGDWKQMFSWADKALSMMDANEFGKFDKDFIIFSTDLFQRRQFSESAILSEKSLDKICNTDSKNKKTFFKNANITYLAEKQFDKSRSLINKAQSCKIPTDAINAGNLELLNELAASNKWSVFKDLIASLENNKDVQPFLIYPASLIANEFENIGKLDESLKMRNKAISFYENSKKNKTEVPVEGLDAISMIKIATFENEVSSFKGIKLRFPEADYNKTLKLKFSKLEKLATEAESIAAIGSGLGLLKVYKNLIEGYESLRSEILDFTPPGKSEEYVKSFKKSMESLTTPLLKQSKEFRELAIKKIEKEEVLSPENSWFLTENNIFNPVFQNVDGGAVMDKAGLK